MQCREAGCCFLSCASLELLIDYTSLPTPRPLGGSGMYLEVWQHLESRIDNRNMAEMAFEERGARPKGSRPI